MITVRECEIQQEKIIFVDLNEKIEVAAENGFLRFWCDGQEVRVGPISKDQAEILSDDLGYEAVG